MAEPFVLKWDPETVKRMDLGLLYCPDCRQRMILKEGPHGLFYSCSGFPSCFTTHPAIQEGLNVGQPDGRLLPRESREIRQKCKNIIREKFTDQKSFFAWKSKTLRTKVAVKAMGPSELALLLEKLDKARGNK